jgi:hypothetical protein
MSDGRVLQPPREQRTTRRCSKGSQDRRGDFQDHRSSQSTTEPDSGLRRPRSSRSIALSWPRHCSRSLDHSLPSTRARATPSTPTRPSLPRTHPRSTTTSPSKRPTRPPRRLHRCHSTDSTRRDRNTSPALHRSLLGSSRARASMDCEASTCSPTRTTAHRRSQDPFLPSTSQDALPSSELATPARKGVDHPRCISHTRSSYHPLSSLDHRHLPRSSPRILRTTLRHPRMQSTLPSTSALDPCRLSTAQRLSSTPPLRIRTLLLPLSPSAPTRRLLSLDPYRTAPIQVRSGNRSQAFPCDDRRRNHALSRATSDRSHEDPTTTATCSAR